jgi:hypothetical protein
LGTGIAEAKTRRYREPNTHHGSTWFLVIVIGAVVSYVGLIVDTPPMVMRLPISVSGAIGWLRDDLYTTPRAFYGVGPQEGAILGRVSARKLASWLFLATEVIIFSAIIDAAWTGRLRATGPGGLPRVYSGQDRTSRVPPS